LHDYHRWSDAVWDVLEVDVTRRWTENVLIWLDLGTDRLVSLIGAIVMHWTLSSLPVFLLIATVKEASAVHCEYYTILDSMSAMISSFEMLSTLQGVA
jgi:uncharacterized membrane protein